MDRGTDRQKTESQNPLEAKDKVSARFFELLFLKSKVIKSQSPIALLLCKMECKLNREAEHSYSDTY